MNFTKLLFAVVALLALVWLWPNLVHEPAHYLALQVQGVPAKMNFDFGFPSHPSITRMGSISVIGGLFFLLAPSLLSIALLAVIWLTRRSSAAILTHLVLPAYLTFDLVLNIIKFQNLISDFHFLVALPSYVWMVSALLVAAVGCVIIAKSLRIMLQPSFELQTSLGKRGG